MQLPANIRLAELFLTVLILLLFLAKLIMIFIYQQKTGDYFTNKLFFGYSNCELYGGTNARRQQVMRRANVVAIAFWAASILLLAMTVIEKLFK